MLRKKWKNWGLPYQGSKNRMMSWLSQNIPTSGECFVDLFCGGCSVTHYMMVNGHFDKYIINDVNPMMPKAFTDAINGKFHDERRWISREEFKRTYDTDFYAACCFSFGNNYKNYAYSPTIEPFKKACHYAILLGDWEKLRLLYPELADKGEKLLNGVDDFKARRRKLVSCLQKELKEIGRCHLQSMEALERIQDLETLTGGGISIQHRLQKRSYTRQCGCLLRHSLQEYGQIRVNGKVKGFRPRGVLPMGVKP